MMEGNYAAIRERWLYSCFLGSGDQDQLTTKPGDTLIRIEDTLLSVISNPTEFADSISPHFNRTILSTKLNANDGSYLCSMHAYGSDFTLTQASDSSDLYISTTTSTIESIVLRGQTIATLKEALLIQYITTQRSLGQTPVDLSQFDLSNVDLSKVSLVGTMLNQENVLAVIASKGDLSGAILKEGTNVEGLSFTGVKMDGPMLLSLIDGRAKLSGIDVSGKDLSGLSLINVDFSYANFTNTNLNNTNLKRANFTGANFTRATLNGALIHLARFYDVIIEESQIKSAIGRKYGKYIMENLPQLMRGKFHNVYNTQGNPKANSAMISIADGAITLTELGLFGVDQLSTTIAEEKEESDSISVNDQVNQTSTTASNKTVDRLTPHLKMGKNSEFPNQSRNCEVRLSDRSFIDRMYDPVFNYFGKFHFGLIVCRHSASQFIVDTLSSGGKANLRKYSHEQMLTQHIPSTIEQTVHDLWKSAKEAHLIKNDHFGSFLSDQFVKMESEGKTVRALGIVTGNHLMSVCLRISQYSRGEKKYSIQFLEPNIGEACLVHSRANNPHHFKYQTLLNYIGSEKGYKLYYEKQADMASFTSLIYVHETLLSPTTSGIEQEATPKNLITDEDLSALLEFKVYVCMTKCFIKPSELINYNKKIDDNLKKLSLTKLSYREHTCVNLVELKKELTRQHVAKEDVLALLGYYHREEVGDSWINQALYHGRAKDIQVYGELLELVKDDKQVLVKLLCADSVINKVLTVARLFGYTEAIEACNEIRKRFLPSDFNETEYLPLTYY